MNLNGPSFYDDPEVFAAYMGVDRSHQMVAAAPAQLAGSVGIAVWCPLENLSLPDATFDRECSRLALHYVEDISRLISIVNEVRSGPGAP